MNTQLTTFVCNNNLLTTLNVANGNNTSLGIFDASNNPNLTCIQVDDVTYSTTNWTNIDAEASFSKGCGTAGISESKKELVNIYPNPVQNELFVQLEEGQITQLDILDLSGKVIKTITSSNAKSIDVSNLTQGVYMLKVYTETGVSPNRFVKQ